MIRITIYIINILIVMFMIVIRKNNYNFGNQRFRTGDEMASVFIFISFTLIMAMRSLNVGVDTSPYSRIYTIICNSDSFIGALKKAPLSAPIYVLMCRGLSYISNDPQFLIIVSSILVNIGLFIFIKRTKADTALSSIVWIGLTLYYCSMNGNRQCISVVIALNAIIYLSENIKSLKGWGLFIVSIGIHATALFFIIAILGTLLAKKINNNKITFLISTIISVVITVIFTGTVKVFLRIFPRYSLYTSGNSQYSIFSSSGGGRIIILYLFLFAIIVLWILQAKKKMIEQDKFNAFILPAVVFCTVFGAINCRNELINRILWYYLALFVSFVPSTIIKSRGNQKKIISFIIVSILIAYSLLSLMENQNGVMPYTFFRG